MTRTIGLTLLSLLVAQFFGLFFAILPLTASVFPEQLKRDLAGNSMTLIIALKTFASILLGGYLFAFFGHFLNAVATALSFGMMGFLKQTLSVYAFFVAFVLSLLLSTFFYWEYLSCQCHPNLAGAHFTKPIVFVGCHLFLAGSSWLVMRHFWSKSRA